MSVKIDAVDYWGGSPKWLNSYPGSGYWIRGRGFGTKLGIVTIDGEAQNVVSWEPDKILIAKPSGNTFRNPARALEVMVEVMTAKRGRLAVNDPYYVAAA